jgi:hypothetical protein
MVRAVGALLNNPWEMPKINGVEMKVKVSYDRDSLFLRGAQTLESEVDPGQPLRVRLTLAPYLGTPQTKVIEVPIPPQLAGETVRVDIRPGYMERRLVPDPEDFKELFRVLPKLDFPGESLVASFKIEGEASAAFRGNVAHRLPPHAADMLRTTTQSVAPEVFAAVKQVVIPTKGFVIGNDTVEVKVRKVVR